MYRIETDEGNSLIRISVEGFWTVAEVQSFAAALGAQAQAFAATGRPPNLLYDYSSAVIQSQEVVAALQDLVRRAPAKAQKVALFTCGQLAHRQARRVAEAGAQVRVFEQEGDAIAWLAA